MIAWLLFVYEFHWFSDVPKLSHKSLGIQQGGRPDKAYCNTTKRYLTHIITRRILRSRYFCQVFATLQYDRVERSKPFYYHLVSVGVYCLCRIFSADSMLPGTKCSSVARRWLLTVESCQRQSQTMSGEGMRQQKVIQCNQVLISVLSWNETNATAKAAKGWTFLIADRVRIIKRSKKVWCPALFLSSYYDDTVFFVHSTSV